jgi:hypothetical protein
LPFSEPISLKCNLSVYAKQKTLASLIPARVSVFLSGVGRPYEIATIKKSDRDDGKKWLFGSYFTYL